MKTKKGNDIFRWKVGLWTRSFPGLGGTCKPPKNLLFFHHRVPWLCRNSRQHGRLWPTTASLDTLDIGFQTDHWCFNMASSSYKFFHDESSHSLHRLWNVTGLIPSRSWCKCYFVLDLKSVGATWNQLFFSWRLCRPGTGYSEEPLPDLLRWGVIMTPPSGHRVGGQCQVSFFRCHLLSSCHQRLQLKFRQWCFSQFLLSWIRRFMRKMSEGTYRRWYYSTDKSQTCMLMMQSNLVCYWGDQAVR